MEANMFVVNLLEEAGSDTISIWIPIVVLGWFLLMTIVGWQVSHRNPAVGNGSQEADASHSESSPPSEIDNH